MMRPLILLNCSHKRRQGRDIHFWDAAYTEAVFDAGGEPLLISPIINISYIERIISMAAGFVLIGSDDIPPEWYGQKKNPRTKVMTKKRAKFDRILGEALLHANMPILAVCGGMQLLNVLAGGTLIQHLPRCDIHRGTLKEKKEHIIKIRKETNLQKIIGEREVLVNSFHHQGVDKVGECFVVSAWSEDGVVEGLETADGRMICVQWHPEREGREGRTRSALFGWLVETAKKNRNGG